MTKDEFKQCRRRVAARHDPPLVHLSDAAEVLNKSVDATRWALEYYGLEEFYLPRPFLRGKYFELSAVERLAEQLSQKRSI